ncbi:DUF2252_family protein [Hexamita inflata]|uniref:DUF2252 family protein n=1 Tax=Hexamita inflata TaxID=28002 RepID=A0AA86TXV4_9EUKA|nr:DUF2252 family protein [Hexamita inflata]
MQKINMDLSAECINCESVSDYDKQMIQMHQNQILKGTLSIKDAQNVNFIQFLNLNKLEIRNCENQIPTLKSKTIKQLKIICNNILNVEEFKLEKLEDLELINYTMTQSDIMAQEIVKLQLKELSLYQWIIDVSIFSQMSTLTKITLKDCEIEGIQALKSLHNLRELSMCGNKGISTTQLQYLTQLTKLCLMSCNLVNVDALQHLTKLQDLNILGNNIVYTQPLLRLTYLSKLDAKYNYIIDSQTIQQHQNFKNFKLVDQQRPTEELLKLANKLRDISNPITSLKQICKKSRHCKHLNIIFRKKITRQLQDACSRHEQIFAKAALLFQSINVLDDCQ